MLRSIMMFICCTAVLGILIPVSYAQQMPDQTNPAGGYRYLVDVKSVINRAPAGSDKILYEVTYRYEFAGLESIFINGLGVVSAKKDSVSYLTSDNKLEFRESATGAVIITVPLRVTAATQSGGGPEVPQVSDFSTAVRTGTWGRHGNFSDYALRVIEKYFPSGFTPLQRGPLSFYITTYRTLKVPGGMIRAEIAVMLSQPHDESRDKLSYHIQYVIRDKPRLSTEWSYGQGVTEKTKEQAAEFINDLVNELAGAGN
jgi:hypothetical protein